MDICNKYWVAYNVGDGSITIMSPPRGKVSKADALLLAAWLAAIADPLDEHFHKILDAVKNS